jgi:hypothetical protein
MDRLSVAHVRALELEHKHLLERLQWQRLANQASHLAALGQQKKKVFWVRFFRQGLKPGSSF